MKNIIYLLSIAVIVLTLSLCSVISCLTELSKQVEKLEFAQKAILCDVNNNNHLVIDALNLPDTVVKLVPTSADVMALAKLINAETFDLPNGKYISRFTDQELFYGKVAVGDVVLNRVLRYQYSPALKQAIHRRGQFDGIKRKVFNEMPNREDLLAAYLSLSNQGIFDIGIEFFHNPITSTDICHVDQVKPFVLAHYAGHDFAYNKSLDGK